MEEVNEHNFRLLDSKNKCWKFIFSGRSKINDRKIWLRLMVKLNVGSLPLAEEINADIILLSLTVKINVGSLSLAEEVNDRNIQLRLTVKINDCNIRLRL